MWMIYTGVAYIVSFVFLAYFMNGRNRTGTIIMFLINILIAIPTSAYIGVVVAVISLALTFMNGKVKAYYGVA
jgi:hypothetical protein